MVHARREKLPLDKIENKIIIIITEILTTYQTAKIVRTTCLIHRIRWHTPSLKTKCIAMLSTANLKDIKGTK